MPVNWSNDKLYNHILSRIKSNDNIIKIVNEISEYIPYINLDKTLNKLIYTLNSNKLLDLNNETIINFNRKLNKNSFSDYISVKIKSEFYGAYLFYSYNAYLFSVNIGKELSPFDYKIYNGKLYHNKEDIINEILNNEKLKRVNQIDKLPLKGQKVAYQKVLKDFEKQQFVSGSKKHKDYIKYFKKSIKRIEKEEKNIILENQEEDQTKKISAKYYALYHCILIEMGKEKNFERDINDKYSKEEIIEFAKNRYKLKKGRGQGFYNTFINIDLTRKTTLPDEYKDYKQKLIEMSNNDAKVISHLKKYPN